MPKCICDFYYINKRGVIKVVAVAVNNENNNNVSDVYIFRQNRSSYMW